MQNYTARYDWVWALKLDPSKDYTEGIRMFEKYSVWNSIGLSRMINDS